MKNALQSVLKGIKRAKSRIVPEVKGAIRNQLNEQKQIMELGLGPVGQTPKSAYNQTLNLPYKVADVREKIHKGIRPNIPFREENWITEKEYQRRQNTPMPRSEKIRGFASTVSNVPEKTRSAKLQPYRTRPESDISEADRRRLLKSYGFRDEAVDYLSRIPIKVGERYMTGWKHPESGVEPAAQAMSHARIPSRIVLQKEVAKNLPPSLYSGSTQPQQSSQPRPTPNSYGGWNVLRHEYLHQTPRIVPRAIQYRWPVGFKTEQEYRQRWGMKGPGAREGVRKEMFAERDLPSIFYSHIIKGGE